MDMVRERFPIAFSFALTPIDLVAAHGSQMEPISLMSATRKSNF